MNDADRNKRAVVVLAVAVVVILTIYFWPQDAATAGVVEATTSISMAEQRLETVRRLAAQAPEKERQLESLTAAVEELESSLIRTDTAQQAQAEVLQILRRIATKQEPPVEIGNFDLGQVRPYGNTDSYGEVLVSVDFDCAVEQLVNLLAELTHEPQAISVDDLRINAGQQNKILSVRLSVAGLVPSALVPERRGLASF